MGELQRQGGRPPRRVREQRAYRLVQVGATTGIATVVTAVLAVVGVLGWLLPIVLAALTGLTIWRFRGVTAQR